MITIRDIESIDISTIIKISNERFGLEYITETELQSYVSEPEKIGIVALHNDIVIGFSLAQVCNHDALQKLVLADKEWFSKYFAGKDLVGVLKTISVDEKFSKQGIATALTNERLFLLSRRTEHVLALSWDNKEHQGNVKLLENCDLKCSHKIPNYWKADSVKKNYKCVQCGEPPCSCTALIYTNQ